MASTFSRVAGYLGDTPARCTVLAVEACVEMAAVLAFLNQLTQEPNVYITSDGVDAVLGVLQSSFWCYVPTPTTRLVITPDDLGLYDLSDCSLADRCRVVQNTCAVADGPVTQAVVQRYLGLFSCYDTALGQCVRAHTVDPVEVRACVERLTWC